MENSNKHIISLFTKKVRVSELSSYELYPPDGGEWQKLQRLCQHRYPFPLLCAKVGHWMLKM